MQTSFVQVSFQYSSAKTVCLQVVKYTDVSIGSRHYTGWLILEKEENYTKPSEIFQNFDNDFGDHKTH